jgi:hypothetical protein
VRGALEHTSPCLSRLLIAGLVAVSAMASIYTPLLGVHSGRRAVRQHRVRTQDGCTLAVAHGSAAQAYDSRASGDAPRLDHEASVLPIGARTLTIRRPLLPPNERLLPRSVHRFCSSERPPPQRPVV